MVPMGPFYLIGVGIYKKLFTSVVLLLAELVEKNFESEKWAASFE